MGPFGWDYIDILSTFMHQGTRTLDIGTGGGEVFAELARPTDVALDVSLDMLKVAAANLDCFLIAGNISALPFREASFDLVADRHATPHPDEILRVLRPGGHFVTQQVGGRICQSIFDAFGWGSNADLWRGRAEAKGEPYWDVEALTCYFEASGCEILRREEAVVDYEFLDEASLAFWLVNAPLPEVPSPTRHSDILATLSRHTNWHSELLVVRR